jgi:hypothetical protein
VLVFFGLKLAFGLLLLAVYSYYYTERKTADIFKYFDDSEIIYQTLYTHPITALRVITGIGYDDVDPGIKQSLAATQHFGKIGHGLLDANHRLIIRAHLIFRFFSFGSYYIHTLFFSLLSFIGCIGLYRGLAGFFEDNLGRVMVIPVFLVPSILFWSSGMLKETLLMFFFGLVFFAAFRLLQFLNVFANTFILITGLFFIHLLKPYVEVSFIAAFFAMVTHRFRGYPRIIAWLVAIGIFMWFMYAYDAVFCGLMDSIIHKRNEFITLGIAAHAGSLITTDLSPMGCLEPFRLLPSGIYNMFFRPFINSHGLLEFVFGLENLVVLLFGGLCLRHIGRQDHLRNQLAMFSLVFFLMQYVIIGITIPIVGALVRYKILGLLFLLVLLLSKVKLDKFIYMTQGNKSVKKWSDRTINFLFR